jgi:broad specificity phosphatase PhoE
LVRTDMLRFSLGTGPQALIVRHAERFHLPSISESLGIGLTEKGKQDAFEMGAAIEGFGRIRLFHSPALRCRETAEAIARGFAHRRGRVQGIVETWDLCAPYLKDDRVLREAEGLGHGFMRSWFSGQFDPEWIRPTSEAADMVLAPLLQRMAEGDGADRLDIHVSHDWEIALLREELLGVRYEDAGWIDYLGGIHFSRHEDGFLARAGDQGNTFAFSSGRRGR